jgi:hypothetical protein
LAVSRQEEVELLARGIPNQRWTIAQDASMVASTGETDRDLAANFGLHSISPDIACLKYYRVLNI